MAFTLRLLLSVASALCFLIYLLWRPESLPHGIPHSPWTGVNQISTNSTLNFQKVFAISLPKRTDRQDALTLMSALTGLDIEISPGVAGETVMEKTIPRVSASSMDVPGFIGSWRAHLNVMKRVVDEKISTAIVMEDDVDWDVNIREQMARVLQAFKEDQRGLTSDWDVLWLGNAGERFPKDDERKIVLQDPTVPSHNDLSLGYNAVKAFPEHSRIIHPTDFPVCTYAYAVSYAGAQKILYHASQGRVVSNFDTDLGNNCWLYMNCLSVTPPLFHFDRDKGLARDSDTDQGAEKHNLEPGLYKNIENSVRHLMRDKFGKQLRPERVWREQSEYSAYFIEAMDLPGM